MHSIKQGFTFIAAIFIVLVITLLAITTSTFISSDAVIAVKNYHSQDAFYIASAGVEYYLKQLDGDDDWSSPPSQETKTFSDGVFTITTTDEQKNRITFTSTGLITVGATTYQRGIRVEIKGGGLPTAFDYGGYIANPGGETLNLRDQVHVQGDFYYNGPINMYNGADQTDGIIYSESIQIFDQATYVSWESAPEAEMPEWNNSYYDDILSMTSSTAAGALNKSTSATWNLDGGTYYYTDITISKGEVNGPGTLVATGNPSGNGDINMIDTGKIGSNVRLIAKGDVTFSNATSFGANLEVYAYGRFIDNNGRDIQENSVIYSKSSGEAIYLGDNTEVGSNTTLLAPYGKFEGGSGTKVYGLIYSNTTEVSGSFALYGAVVCYESGDFLNQTWIEYSPAYLAPDIEGFVSTSFEVSSWDEVY
ncbi:MAG: pilus assembly PilX N-terminal domain-containing protein [Candidatus Margulisiibacteriota bacterium]